MLKSDYVSKFLLCHNQLFVIIKIDLLCMLHKVDVVTSSKPR